MKQLFIIIMLSLTSLVSFAQQEKICDLIPAKNGDVYYTGTIKVENINKDALHTSALLWVSETFNSPKNVIQINDNDVLTIISINRIHELIEIKPKITFNFKNNQYTYTIQISDYLVAGKSADKNSLTPFTKCDLTVLTPLNDAITNTINSFETFIANDTKKSQ